MNIDITSGTLQLTPGDQERVTRRIQLAFGRLEENVTDIQVSLATSAGARDGNHVDCSIRLSAPPASLLLRAGGPDVDSAVDRAAEQAGRALSREIARRKTQAHLAGRWNLPQEGSSATA